MIELVGNAATIKQLSEGGRFSAKIVAGWSAGLERFARFVRNICCIGDPF
jgi:hypothetical protein